MPKFQRVIVSCTSTHDRLEYLYYAIESILRQSYKPDNILINVSKTAYLKDQGIEKMPSWSNGDNIKINFVENIGSYRKLLPALDDISDDDLIITIDDDVIYHGNWLKELVDTASNYPSMIVCGRARRIKKNLLGRWQSYHNWSEVKGKTLGFWLLPIGCAGVVYRKKLICEEFITDQKFLEIAKANDDLWFRVASQLKCTKVYVNSELEKGNMHLAHNKGLEKTNLFSPEKKSLLVKCSFKIFGWLLSYLGFLRSNNDIAWGKIITYSASHTCNYITEKKEPSKGKSPLSRGIN